MTKLQRDCGPKEETEVRGPFRSGGPTVSQEACYWKKKDPGGSRRGSEFIVSIGRKERKEKKKSPGKKGRYRKDVRK